MADDADATLSRDEIAQAIRSFTSAEWARLKLVSLKYVGLTRWEADDLLHEAITRALEGGRACRTTIDLVRTLAEAMRSIADGEYEKLENRAPTVPVINASHALSGALDLVDQAPHAEQILLLRGAELEQRIQVLGLFNGDQAAYDIVEGTMEGLTAKELRDLLGLNETAYASKRRYIRRTIDKMLTKGPPL